MTIEDLIRRIIYENEEYTLEKAVAGEKDELGYPKKTWVEVAKLNGIIQKQSTDPLGERGSEERAEYMGFFAPTFNIEPNKLKQYRIKHIFRSGDAAFTRYFRIREIDRDLRLENSRHHYELQLELYKKW